jgi:hypothetical protein
LKWGKTASEKLKIKPLYPMEEENSLIKNNEIGEQKKNPLLKKLASPHIYIHTEINNPWNGTVLMINLAKINWITWQSLRMGVAYAVLPLNGGYELVDQRVRRRRRRSSPDLGLQVLNQLLIRRVELHPRRQPHPVLHTHACIVTHSEARSSSVYIKT